MEFKKFMSLGMKTEEGVLITKYLVAIHKAEEANVVKIKNLFDSHGYDLSVIPGAFIRMFTANEKEIAELEKGLITIDNLGLKGIFNANLSVNCFKPAFISKIEWCINNGLPYLNSDNTFISPLYRNEEFGEYSAQVPMEKIKTVQEIDKNPENKLSQMDAEDTAVYNEVIEKLSYLVLANPTDEFLIKVVKNIREKVVDAITRKEYKFLSLTDMINNIMFEGLDVNPMDSIRVEELISGAFPEVQERNLA